MCTLINLPSESYHRRGTLYRSASCFSDWSLSAGGGKNSATSLWVFAEALGLVRELSILHSIRECCSFYNGEQWCVEATEEKRWYEAGNVMGWIGSLHRVIMPSAEKES
ncbi:hypothetical protein MKW98_008401, partial [Papaver atlanticum]